MTYLKSKKVRLGRRSFTLVELLVVIGIVTVLSIVLIVTLNPIELFREARDSKRITELTSLDRALKLYQTEKGCISLGDPALLYISLPDADPSCGSYPNLPNPAPFSSYRCVPQTNLTNSNGSGWIPVDFTQLAAGALTVLPIDPLNYYNPANFISNHFYEYAISPTSPCDYEINAKMESVKYGLGGG